MRLQAVLIPVILEISSMSLNSEASRVLFLNQTFLKIEKYMKNGQPSLMDNLPSNAMFRYVLILSERKSSGCTYMIVKHEFSYFKTCVCFCTEQLVARILSNKYIWLLLKYKIDELGTHSNPQRKCISITRDGV